MKTLPVELFLVVLTGVIVSLWGRVGAIQYNTTYCRCEEYGEDLYGRTYITPFHVVEGITVFPWYHSQCRHHIMYHTSEGETDYADPTYHRYLIQQREKEIIDATLAARFSRTNRKQQYMRKLREGTSGMRRRTTKKAKQRRTIQEGKNKLHTVGQRKLPVLYQKRQYYHWREPWAQSKLPQKIFSKKNTQGKGYENSYSPKTGYDIYSYDKSQLIFRCPTPPLDDIFRPPSSQPPTNTLLPTASSPPVVVAPVFPSLSPAPAGPVSAVSPTTEPLTASVSPSLIGVPFLSTSSSPQPVISTQPESTAPVDQTVLPTDTTIPTASGDQASSPESAAPVDETSSPEPNPPPVDTLPTPSVDQTTSPASPDDPSASTRWPTRDPASTRWPTRDPASTRWPTRDPASTRWPTRPPDSNASDNTAPEPSSSAVPALPTDPVTSSRSSNIEQTISSASDEPSVLPSDSPSDVPSTDKLSSIPSIIISNQPEQSLQSMMPSTVDSPINSPASSIGAANHATHVAQTPTAEIRNPPSPRFHRSPTGPSISRAAVPPPGLFRSTTREPPSPNSPASTGDRLRQFPTQPSSSSILSSPPESASSAVPAPVLYTLPSAYPTWSTSFLSATSNSPTPSNTDSASSTTLSKSLSSVPSIIITSSSTSHDSTGPISFDESSASMPRTQSPPNKEGNKNEHVTFFLSLETTKTANDMLVDTIPIQKTSSTRKEATNAQRARDHNLFRYREYRQTLMDEDESIKQEEEEVDDEGEKGDHELYQEQF